MVCVSCKKDISRDGKWKSIRVYEEDNMVAYPICKNWWCVVNFAESHLELTDEAKEKLGIGND